MCDGWNEEEQHVLEYMLIPTHPWPEAETKLLYWLLIHHYTKGHQQQSLLYTQKPLRRAVCSWHHHLCFYIQHSKVICIVLLIHCIRSASPLLAMTSLMFYELLSAYLRITVQIDISI